MAIPVSKTRRKMKKKQFGCYNSCCSNNLEIVQVSCTSTACHYIYAFLMTTLLGFLQLKYQNKNVSPFETHPTNIKAFFLTLCVYCFIQLAKAVFQTHCTSYSLILSHFSLISGVTSSLSLLTIFFPSWLTKLVISIFGVFIPLILGRHWIEVIKQWLGEKTTSAVIYAIDVFRRLMRRNLMQQQQRPFVV